MASNESTEDIKQAVNDVKKATSVNWDSVFSAITTGEPIKTANAKHVAQSGGVLEPEPISMDLDGFANSQAAVLGYKGASKQSYGVGADLTPIMYEISKYKFSSVNTQKDIEETAVVIRNVLRKRIAGKIMNNSKRICSYASDFFQSDDGMRGVFKILGNKYSMKATGEFCGEEHLFCAAQGDQIVGGVFMKDQNGDFIDVSNKFKVLISKL